MPSCTKRELFSREATVLNCQEVKKLLDAYLDEDPNDQERLLVELHLEGCSTCSEEFDLLKALPHQTSLLPGKITPSRGLWQHVVAGIERNTEPSNVRRLSVPAANVRRGIPRHTLTIARPHSPRARLSRWNVGPLAIAVSIIIAAGSFWFSVGSGDATWGVACVEGIPRVGNNPVSDRANLNVGEWLETDPSSRARVEVGMIGQLDVEPNTRLRLVGATITDHRIYLDRGMIHSTIWAPPRLFFVEIPSALAIDLGCAYSLQVDAAGASLLEVTDGFVALKWGGRQSIVPAGAACRTTSGVGPGTPFDMSASEAFQEALARFDCAHNVRVALITVLSQARREDAVTLWHLLTRTGEEDLSKVYDKLALLAPPPPKVDKAGVIAGDGEMLNLWAKEIGISQTYLDL